MEETLVGRDLGIEDIANDLTSLERPRYKQVIEADLVSPKNGAQAHAQEIDAARIGNGAGWLVSRTRHLYITLAFLDRPSDVLHFEAWAGGLRFGR